LLAAPRCGYTGSAVVTLEDRVSIGRRAGRPAMRGPRPWVGVAAAFLVMIALSATVSAELVKPSDPEALAHFDQGTRYYRVGEFEKALESYKQALMIEEASATWFNIAQASRQAGNYEQAEWFYRRLLARAPLTDEERSHVEGLIEAMRAEREQAARQKPPLEAAPLEPAAASPSAPHSDRAPRDPRWHDDTLGWGITGGGFAVTAVGVGLLYTASSLRSQARMEPVATERDRLRSAADRRRTFGLIVTGTGAVAAGIGVVKLAIVPKRGTGMSADLAVGLQGIVIQGRF
jgi:hypothetical protein